MADDQVRLLVLILQRRLEPPHFDLSIISTDPRVAVVLERLAVELGVAALDDDLVVPFGPEDVDDLLGEGALDKRVEAGRAHSGEDVHLSEILGTRAGLGAEGDAMTRAGSDVLSLCLDDDDRLELPPGPSNLSLYKSPPFLRPFGRATRP